jgi:hypothetical protein
MQDTHNTHLMFSPWTAVLNEARDGPLRYRLMLVRYYVISVRQILVECTTRLPPKNTCDEHVTCDTDFSFGNVDSGLPFRDSPIQ